MIFHKPYRNSIQMVLLWSYSDTDNGLQNIWKNQFLCEFACSSASLEKRTKRKLIGWKQMFKCFLCQDLCSLPLNRINIFSVFFYILINACTISVCTDSTDSTGKKALIAQWRKMYHINQMERKVNWLSSQFCTSGNISLHSKRKEIFGK